jgi:glutaredoxin
MPRKWWQFWVSKRSPRRIVVYTRANCSLCDQTAAFLEAERERRGFPLEYVDIAGNVELTERHGDWIPVVEVDGKVRFRGKIDPVLWRRLFERQGERGK